MDWIVNLISAFAYNHIPVTVQHNPWFALIILAAYAAVSEVMPFLPTKGNGPVHGLLIMLGLWKDKEKPYLPPPGGDQK
jgi:hypothetical protein